MERPVLPVLGVLPASVGHRAGRRTEPAIARMGGAGGCDSPIEFGLLQSGELETEGRAVRCCFGTGIGVDLGWHDNEVRRRKLGLAWIVLHDAGAGLMQWQRGRLIHLSLSHRRRRRHPEGVNPPIPNTRQDKVPGPLTCWCWGLYPSVETLWINRSVVEPGSLQGRGGPRILGTTWSCSEGGCPRSPSPDPPPCTCRKW